MKRCFISLCALLFIWSMIPAAGYGAYHHEGEDDAPNFLAVYPDKAQTKLDNCALCHKGGTYGGKTYGSCQYCHAVYNLTAPPGEHGSFQDTLNGYGLAYQQAGSSQAAISAIEDIDSDGDGYTNIVEIQATRYPGDANDDPTKVPAPARVYTKAQLEAMPLHTQFMLMNATRSDDNYAEYTGIPMKDLLDDAGIMLDSATGIIVYSPDGFSWDHPLNPVSGKYHVYGNAADQDYQYPPATYYYDEVPDKVLYPSTGWCYWDAASCTGRTNGDSISVGDGGLKAILAIKREGSDLVTGVLNNQNKLDGEGPFRVVVPQVVPCAPDQKSTNSNDELIWPYISEWDHNAGACTRTATIIKVLPLPEGTTDIDVMEAGWSYVDSEKIVIYGAIDGSDYNGNGILDREESDDGSEYYKDSSMAYPYHAKGREHVLIHTSAGNLASVQVMTEDDPSISQTGRPDGIEFPYGAFKFTVTDITPGEMVTISITFPYEVPAGSHYYKLSQSGGAWTEIPFTSSTDGRTIYIAIQDGGAFDADGQTNGSILDPGTLGVPIAGSDDDDDDDWCFITTAISPSWSSMLPVVSFIMIPFTAVWFRKRSNRAE